MEDPGLSNVSQVLADSDLRIEKTKDGYCLVVEGKRDSFRSVPMSSKADAEAARRVFKQLAGWTSTEGTSSSEAQGPTGQEIEESMPETMEELTRQITNVSREQAGSEVPRSGVPEGGALAGERPRPEEPDQAREEPTTEEATKRPEEQEAEGPREQKLEEPAEKELKDPEWREKEVQRTLRGYLKLCGL